MWPRTKKNKKYGMGCSSNMTPSQTLLPVSIEIEEKSGDLSTSCYTYLLHRLCYTDSCYTDCALQMGHLLQRFFSPTSGRHLGLLKDIFTTFWEIPPVIFFNKQKTLVRVWPKNTSFSKNSWRLLRRKTQLVSQWIQWAQHDVGAKVRRNTVGWISRKGTMWGVASCQQHQSENPKIFPRNFWKCYLERVGRLITPVQTCQHEKGSLAGYWRMIAAFLAEISQKVSPQRAGNLFGHRVLGNNPPSPLQPAFKMVIFGISWALIRLLSTFQSTQAIKFPSDSVLKLNIANYVWILEGNLFWIS